MLTGKALGDAIKSALDKAGLSQADVARKFKIKPPSVSGWITTGRISKPNFEELRQFLSNVVGPEHWGLTSERTDRFDDGRGNKDKVLSDGSMPAQDRSFLDALGSGVKEREIPEHIRQTILTLISSSPKKDAP